MPVGTLLGQQPPRPSRWHAVLQWRDWKLPVKLAAITLVPIVIALILGVVTIANQVERADSYQRIDRLVTLNEKVRATLDGLQRERTETAAVLTAGSVGGSPALDAVRGEVDSSIAPLRDAAEKGGEYDPRVIGPSTELSDQLDRLRGIRDAAVAGQLDPVQAVNDYTVVTTALLKLDTTIVAGISDAAIGGAPSAMHDLDVAKEDLSVERALVAYGIARGNLAPSEISQLRTAEVRLNDRLTDFRASASQIQRQDFDSTAAGPSFQTRERLIQTVLGEEELPSEEALRTTSAEQWQESSSAVIQRVADVSGRLGSAVGSVSGDLVSEASSAAGLLAVLLFSALLLAAAVVFLINRQLLRSLSLLRTGALDIADRQLPAAVQNIQDGQVQSTEITPVAVGSRDEVGEVARAFDEVHSQALRLAVDQAAMRTGYSTVFVNLSRRSQSLVQRQLQLIERLERDEEDADQLATLFQLDHLATRMRRNNENLMVLSGSEPGRRSGSPISTTDVLRAAVSEIEQYQRVVVQTPPASRILGYAASDLMRLIAELLDNATAFSAPETKVTVSTRRGDDGSLSIDILDKGIGMNEAEVREANTRLSEAVTVDLATSRRMGLFVVGRLASRHGVQVRLHGGKDITGVRATVTVSAELVLGPPGPGAPPERPAPPLSGVDRSSGSLPRRQPPSNGTGRSGMLAHFSPQAEVAAQPGAPAIERTNGTGLPAPRANGVTPRPGTAGRPPEVEITGTSLFSPVAEPGTEEPPASPESEEPAVESATPKPADDTESAGEEQESARSVNGDSGTARGRTPSWDALPGGKTLFAANSSALTEWWKAETTAADAERAARAAERPPLSETTPIFDAMLSVWFRAEPATPAASPTRTPDAAPAEQDGNWDFAVDERWRTVQAVSKTEPESYTDSGLPRRRRGEQLLPGSAAGTPTRATEPDTASGPDVPVRDPAQIRGRLSSFQQGVSRGRRRARAAEGEQTPAVAGTASPAVTPPAGKPDVQESATTPETHAPETHGPAAQAQGSHLAAPHVPAPEPRVSAPAETPPEISPETTAPQPAVSAGAQAADPGPQVTAEARTTAGDFAQQAQWPGGQTTDPELEAGSAQSQVVATTPAQAGESPASAADGWNFAADDRWRTVQSVSQSAPVSFTQSGLPRRRRGEQLMPGSAASSAPASGPRTARDAHDVRGRLSSFQQGIRRGRHHSAQSADGNQEKVEGE
ncbi:histidine kinase [Amycolatopsis antarctica]|uniref:histidine kinase n=1 Tax=Amycolatopsis antarctica TaxID=1854586 RepID=A0A263D7S3_9PSEU|nr:histidine kinase [Amycolatopsis antarctica]